MRDHSRTHAVLLAWLLPLGCHVSAGGGAAEPPPAQPQPGPELAPTTGPITAPQLEPPERALQVSELLAEPDRFVDEPIELEAHLAWEQGGCTRSVPSTCQDLWFLVDVDNGRPRLRLVDNGVAVPVVCTNAASSPFGSSPSCPANQILDTHAHYLLRGTLQRVDADLVFVPVTIQVIPTN